MTPSKIIDFVLFFPAFLFSLALHESAHGWVANWRGDPTAKDLGRITLNPIPHMDPFGTLILPAMGFFLGGFIFGWGIPVPVNFRNFKNLRLDGLLVAIAGPVSNLLLACVVAGLIHVLYAINPLWFTAEYYNASRLIGALVQMVFLNLALTFFNLIPIRPLDGGMVLYGLLPPKWGEPMLRFFSRYGFAILMLLVMSRLTRVLVGVPVSYLAGLLL